ncbi:MAG: hypothetical protein ABI318_07815 [Chthoniobacteraceae bacterium]
MQLTDEQKQKVSAWIADGMKLSDIQVRLGEDCELRMTYMDVRMLVDDLKLVPKDPPAPVAEKTEPAASGAAVPAPAEATSVVADSAAPSKAKISLTVDQIARPGTMVSGSVTFSDGKTGAWYLDQQGRLGVVPGDQGYRPPEGDVEEFQVMLDRELQKLGY